MQQDGNLKDRFRHGFGPETGIQPSDDTSLPIAASLTFSCSVLLAEEEGP